MEPIFTIEGLFIFAISRRNFMVIIFDEFSFCISISEACF